MNSEWTPIVYGALLGELQQVFDTRTAEVLLSVVSKVVTRACSELTREDFSELKQIVAELAEAQRQTDEHLSKLAEALTDVGFTREELAAFMGGNVYRVLGKYLL
jgi:3-dehydroquinate synthetase